MTWTRNYKNSGTDRLTNIEDGVTAAIAGGGGGTQTLAQTLALGADANSLAITGLADPTNAQDAATKAYVDADTDTLAQVLAAGANANAVTITNLGAPSSANDAATKTYVDAHAGTSSKAVNQTAHGFSVGNIIRYNGTAWVKAKADSSSNADADAIVSVVTDANNFTASLPGSDVTGLSGLTAGQDYFLDPTTAGAVTTTEPSTAGQVSVPVVKALSTTESIFAPKRGLVIPAAAKTYFLVKVTDDSTSVTVGEGKFGITIQSDLNAKNLTGVKAMTTVAPTGTALSFGIRKNAATEMLTTNVTIDTTKTTSDQSATQPVIKSDGSQTVATGDIVWIDCDQADSNAVSRGSQIRLEFS